MENVDLPPMIRKDIRTYFAINMQTMQQQKEFDKFYGEIKPRLKQHI